MSKVVPMALYEKYNKLMMPNLFLSDEEVNGLIDYMDAVSKQVAGAPVEKVTELDGAHGHDHTNHVH